MTAKIAGLTQYPRKGEPGVPLREMNLLQDRGIEGDFHQGGVRQVSLLSTEIRRWQEAQPQKGLCFERFRENLLIDGISLERLEIGTPLCVGDAVLRVSALGKRCFGECALFSGGMPCRLSERACFAAVIRSGTVRVGDSVEIVPLEQRERTCAKWGT